MQRQEQRVLVRLQMFGNNCNPDISMRKLRNKAGELLISGFHCQGKNLGFHLTDEDSQQVRHLLGSACKKVPLSRECRKLVMRHHKSSGKNQGRGM